MMCVFSVLLLSSFTSFVLSQSVPSYQGEDYYFVDTCLNYTNSGWSMKYMCTTVNGMDAVRQYVWADDLSCGGVSGADVSSPSSYYGGITLGGCDQSSRTIYRVDNCTAALDNVGSSQCGYYQFSSTGARYPVNTCMQDRFTSNCRNGGVNSCRSIFDLSDGNITLYEYGFDSYDCSGNSTGMREWDAPTELHGYNVGDDNCFTRVTEYTFSGTYTFCNSEKDNWQQPNGIVENPRYYYKDGNDFSISYGSNGLIYETYPIVIDQCYGQKDGYATWSYMYTCNNADRNVEGWVWMDTMDCKGDNYYVDVKHSYDADDNYHNCEDSSASSKVSGTYDTFLWYPDTLNGDGTRRSGGIGCKACYHYYADYSDLAYYNKELMVVRSTIQKGNWLTYNWYLNGQCEKPILTRFDVLNSRSFSQRYPRYEIKGCSNSKNNINKKFIKTYYSSSYYTYWK